MLRYLFFLLFPLVGFLALSSNGMLSGSLIVLAFVLIPLFELILPTTPRILSKEKVAALQESEMYSYLLYLLVPSQFILLAYFLIEVRDASFSYVLILKIVTMGILCGTMAINIAHELGHRQRKFDQFLAKALLMTSLYMHFFIEHNRGHHKNVATPNDPATARKNESIYVFVVRCIVSAYRSAWRLENERLARNNKSKFNFDNAMIQYGLVQLLFLIGIYAVFGSLALICFISAAILGFILLECIEYIEHYGLSREELKPGIYCSVQNKHSWNCNKMLGRLMLFELPLHPAHHKNSSIKYQALQSTDDAPEMPLGYPGMILLALIPPLWFRKINPLLAN
jgi:alkane 1-monooxygenase